MQQLQEQEEVRLETAERIGQAWFLTFCSSRSLTGSFFSLSISASRAYSACWWSTPSASSAPISKKPPYFIELRVGVGLAGGELVLFDQSLVEAAGAVAEDRRPGRRGHRRHCVRRPRCASGSAPRGWCRPRPSSAARSAARSPRSPPGGGGFSPRGMRPKYFLASARASSESKSPTSAAVMLLGA